MITREQFNREMRDALNKYIYPVLHRCKFPLLIGEGCVIVKSERRDVLYVNSKGIVVRHEIETEVHRRG